MDKSKKSAELAYIAAVFADILSRNLDEDDLQTLAAFTMALSDDIALILATKTCNNTMGAVSK